MFQIQIIVRYVVEPLNDAIFVSDVHHRVARQAIYFPRPSIFFPPVSVTAGRVGIAAPGAVGIARPAPVGVASPYGK